MSNVPIAIVGWLTSIMLAASPPEKRVSACGSDPEAFLAAERARYGELAEAVAEAAYDPALSSLYRGSHGRANTAVMMLSVAWHESGFRRDVDLGEGSRSRGDNGASCTIWQFNLGTKGRTRDGWTCSDLYADRTKAARSALGVLRSSMSMCGSLAPEFRLSAYTAGRCEDGQEQSRSRVLTARKWLASYAPPLSDAEVADQLAEQAAMDFRREGAAWMPE